MTFDEIYAEFKQIDGSAYAKALREKSMRVLPALFALSGNEKVGARFLSMFVLGAAASDGELAEAEYELLEPMFTAFFADEVSFAESKALVKAMADRGELTRAADEAIDFFGALDSSIKAELVLICLIICAVDGEVSEAEKKWIAELAA